MSLSAEIVISRLLEDGRTFDPREYFTAGSLDSVCQRLGLVQYSAGTWTGFWVPWQLSVRATPRFSKRVLSVSYSVYGQAKLALWDYFDSDFIADRLTQIIALLKARKDPTDYVDERSFAEVSSELRRIVGRSA